MLEAVKLVTAERRVLSDTLETLQATGLQDGASLTAAHKRTYVAAAQRFCLMLRRRQLCRERTTVTCVRMALFCSNLLPTKSSQTTRDFQLDVVLQQISWRFLCIGNAGLPTVCFLMAQLCTANSAGLAADLS